MHIIIGSAANACGGSDCYWPLCHFCKDRVEKDSCFQHSYQPHLGKVFGDTPRTEKGWPWRVGVSQEAGFMTYSTADVVPDLG